MYRFDDGYMGYPRIEDVVPVPANLRVLGISPGFIAPAEDPVWGPGEFIFARAGASIRLGGVCVLTPVWDATNLVVQQNMTEVPNTANLGRSLYIYMGSTAITVGQYGWFMRSGVYPVNMQAAVAADTTWGIAAAGQGGANSAGKQALNSRVTIASTQTVVTGGGRGAVGDSTIFGNNFQGFFPGVYVSGTGVGAAAICSSVASDYKSITVTVVNSAAVTGNITATYNNATIFWNVAAMDVLLAQGAIT